MKLMAEIFYELYLTKVWVIVMIHEIVESLYQKWFNKHVK